MTAAPLAAFQAAFIDELFAAPGESGGAYAAQPAFAVYRNTVLRGCIDALQANYPAVARLVGEAWFRAAAAVFARIHAPSQPMLIDYGEDFAAFLARFEPAAALPYLPAVAQLDRLWTEAHLAADAPVLDAGDVAAWSSAASDRLETLRLAPHPAARWRWFDDLPALAIWQRGRGAVDITGRDDDLDWQGEGALLTRPAGAVQVQPLSPAGVALLDACASGARLGEALEAAVGRAGLQPLGGLLSSLVVAGAFRAPPDALHHRAS
jgi:hypothetical protein